jgi:hypothetical protein
LSLNKIGRQCGQTIVLTVRPPIFDRYILRVDVPGLLQTLKKGTEHGREALRRSTIQKTEHWQSSLLRTRHERPRSRYSSRRFDEIASSHCLAPKG